MPVTNWMSWDAGVDLLALSQAGLTMPNLILHVARNVHTPLGSAPSGLILFQPDPNAPPLAFGFLSADPAIGAYFGPKIFAGTPFENAPVLKATITIDTSKLPHAVSATVVVGDHTFVSTLTGLKAIDLMHRVPAAMSPFTQQGLEAPATTATLTHNGTNIPLIMPPVSITGGPPAVWSPTGLYAR